MHRKAGGAKPQPTFSSLNGGSHPVRPAILLHLVDFCPEILEKSRHSTDIQWERRQGTLTAQQA
jgi:hypothetical protein